MMRDRSDRYQVQTVSTLAGVKKRLGSYLVEAGLLTTAQLDVALNDQKITAQTTGTHMQLGEIIAARGWVKEQTIEYLMQKVVLPERQSLQGRSQGRMNDTIPQHNQPTVQQPRVLPNNGATVTGKVLKPGATVGRPVAQPHSGVTQAGTVGQPTVTNLGRREAPIAKPLPPVNSSDSDVNWVG